MTETEKWINESLKNLPRLCAEVRRLSEENDSLRARLKKELGIPNTPLTLEELREMGGDPVWISKEQAQAEGVKGWMVATDRNWGKNPNRLIAFRHLWDSTIKSADRALYGWDANPWVWVNEFERISKEEAQQCA